MIKMVFMGLYLGIVLQIILFIFAVRKKEKKLWIALFGLQMIAYTISVLMIFYYNNYVSGFDAPAGIILGFVVAVAYIISFTITASVKIILYEADCKRRQSAYSCPVVLITALLLIVAGVALASYSVLINKWMALDCAVVYIPAWIVGTIIIIYRKNKV